MSARQEEPLNALRDSGKNILRVLILEDSSTEAQTLVDILKDLGYVVTALRVKNAVEFQTALKKQKWDLIFSPFELSSINASQALALLNHAKRDTPIIIVSDAFTQEICLKASRIGARAVVLKNEIEHLQATIERELKDASDRRERQHFEIMYKESDNRCMQLIEASSNPIASISRSGSISTNSAYNKLFDPVNTRGSDINAITSNVHEDDQKSLIELLASIFNGSHHSGTIKVRLQYPGHSEIEASIEASHIYANGQEGVQLLFCIPSLGSKVQTESKVNSIKSIDTNATLESDLADLMKVTGNRSGVIPDSAEKKSTKDTVKSGKNIEKALADNRFRLVYQPIVNLHADPSAIYEVLIRMIDDNGSEVLPADFIPAAENSGLMPKIDRWVIEHAMHALSSHRALGNETSFFIKLSAESIADQTLPGWVGQHLNQLKLPGENIIFEIRESIAIADFHRAMKIFDSLKQLGCRTALGHFGSSPKSLENLDQMRVHFIKLSGPLVDKLSSDPKSKAVIKMLVDTTHNLDTKTIATFVQEASKLTLLWQCGVDYIQGYFVQQPGAALNYNFSNEDAF